MVVPFGVPTSSWRAAVLDRTVALDARLAPHMANMVCAIDGRAVPVDRVGGCCDEVSMWRVVGRSA